MYSLNTASPPYGSGGRKISKYSQQSEQNIPNSYSQISPGTAIHPQLILSNVYRHDDAKTIIQKLINTRRNTEREYEYLNANQSSHKINRVSEDQMLFRHQPITLNSTQDKIFNEVINTMDEIENLKIKIEEEKDQLTKLEVQRSYIHNNSNKDQDIEEISLLIKGINKKELQADQNIRISYVQYQRISKETEEMETKIKKLQLKRLGQLQELAEHYKDHYRKLERKLIDKEKQLKQLNFNTEDISKLKTKIQKLTEENYHLEEAIKNKQVDEELDRLKDDNEILRKKAIHLLSCKDGRNIDTQQRRRLEEYINEEQENKVLFMEDLRKFKYQFNRLKDENNKLKEKISKMKTQNLNKTPPPEAQNQGKENNHKKQRKNYQEVMGRINEIMAKY